MIGLLKKALSICQSGWKEIGNALLGVENKDISTASQTLLTGVKITSAKQGTFYDSQKIIPLSSLCS